LETVVKASRVHRQLAETEGRAEDRIHAGHHSILGYDPTAKPTTLADRMRSYRQRLGLSIKEAAL
jgi:hypothetical protein